MEASGGAPNDTAISDFLDVLEKHRLDCERQGKYDEAELAKVRLGQLRAHEENRRREELRSQQLAERLGVEEAHMKELQEFNEIWDKKVAEFEAHAANLQETLAKQKKYAEAARTKGHADQMEAKEHDAWKTKRDAKISAMEEQFLHKQQLEMGGLLKRIQSGREEQKQARKGELERLLQRYHNVKTQLESQQKIIQQRVDKYPMAPAPGSMAMSRPGTGGGSRNQGSV